MSPSQVPWSTQMWNAPYKGPAQVFFILVLLKSPSGWLCSYSPEGLLPDAAPQPACSLMKLRGKALRWHRMEELLLYSVPLADKRLIRPIVFSKKKIRSPQHRQHVEEEVSVQLWRWGWVITKAVKCRFLSTQLEWWFHFSESTLRANRVIVTLWPGENRVKGFKPPQCPVRKV